MDIITLLKANILRKKGTFISIALLTAIIVTAMTAIFSVRDNYDSAMEKALEAADAGDTTVFVDAKKLSQDLKTSVENSKFVERVIYDTTILGNNTYVGDVTDGNSYFVMKMREGIEIYNDEEDGFLENPTKLGKGEIYFPLGLKSKLDCEVGDVASIDFLGGEREFVIKGFVQEPTQGANTIGWKQVFVSDEDFAEIYEACKLKETEERHFEATMIRIYQAKGSELSATKFQRELNLETKIIEFSYGALTRDQSERYTGLMMEIVTNIIIVFVVFLFVIVLIVMSHSIGTEIEIDYVTLGVLKSQGFSKDRIRLVIFLQYMLAQVIGIILGCAVAYPLERTVSDTFQVITAILPDRGISIGKSLMCMMIILATSIVLIWVKTNKLARISPVRAIAGGREDIYFDSRLNAPIGKKGLSAGIAFRQFTSNTKRYIGTIFVVAILTFFMITVNLIGNLLTSRNALEAMGMIITDIDVYYTKREHENCMDDIEKIVESVTEVKEKQALYDTYISLNGENLMCQLCKYPEYIGGILKGRAALYDNEILITEMVAEALELNMGDKVKVSSGGIEEEFVISGIYQSINDSGMNFSMSFKAGEKLGIQTQWAATGFVLEDTSDLAAVSEKVSKAIKEKYGDTFEVSYYDYAGSVLAPEYDLIVDGLKIIVYVLSVLFAFIVVRMVCVKTFVQERMDIGIYKALGFTSSKLRLLFAIRFLIIAFIGSVLGTGMSVVLSEPLLGKLLSLMGLTQVISEFTIATVVIPVAVVSISFFIFAFIVSGKVKKVEVRELVVE